MKKEEKSRKSNTKSTKKAGAQRSPVVANGTDRPAQNIAGSAQQPAKKSSARPKGKKPQEEQDKPAHKSRRAIRHRKTRTRILTFILVCILLAICIFISLKVLFIVQKVEVVGTERYSREEVAGYCAIPMEESIFRIDLDTISVILPENFTYIESATAQRKLPNKILITVVDAVPTYFVPSAPAESGEVLYTIYSQNFKILTTRAHQPEGLVDIEMDINNPDMVSTFNQVRDILRANDYQNITKMGLYSSSDIFLEYDNRIRINLGTMLDLDYKLKMAYHIIDNNIPVEEMGIIDATVPGQVVYKMTTEIF